MLHLNKVILAGTVVSEVNLETLPSGKTCATIALLYKNSRIKNDKGQFYYIKAWDKKAEMVASYVKKGHPVYIECSLKANSYQNKDGKNVYSLTLNFESIQWANTVSSSATSNEDSTMDDWRTDTEDSPVEDDPTSHLDSDPFINHKKSDIDLSNF